MNLTCEIAAGRCGVTRHSCCPHLAPHLAASDRAQADRGMLDLSEHVVIGEINARRIATIAAMCGDQPRTIEN
jgi:hypothetical protein